MLTRLLFLLCFFATSAWAAPHRFGLAVLEDPTGNETIERIAARPTSDFQPLPGYSYSGGYTRSVHWLRITVSVPADEWWLEVQPPNLDDLRLYQLDPVRPGHYDERRLGDTLPFAAREIDYRGFVYRLQFPEAATHTLFLRLETTSSSMLVLRLWSPPEFLGRVNLEYGLMFSSVAILLTVLLLNVNAWFWLRDPLTPWFIAYLLALTALLTGNAGLLHQYIYPASATANNWVVNLASLLSIALGHAFYRRLFLVDRDQPLLYWIYQSVIWAPILGVFFCWAGYYIETMRLLTATVIPITLLGCALSVRLWRRGAPGGGMMLLANLISMVGVAGFLLFLRGHVAGGFVLMHSLQIASLGTIVVLQIAIGSRYRALRDARIQAEQEVVYEREMRDQQSRFLSMLAHELRTSLSVLRMAISRQPMTPKAIASAERAMVGMSDVIERSIQAEKLSGGSFILETQPCDIVELIEAIVADTPVAQRFQIALDGRPTLKTDAKLLRVILANLIDNASKYAVDETPITLDIENADGFRLYISNVVDSHGAPDPERIFDKFYRAPQAHELTGSGLGLYIARGIAEQLGGSLTCVSGTGQIGFELRLPSRP
jgi:signal transduction histidine kinase